MLTWTKFDAEAPHRNERITNAITQDRPLSPVPFPPRLGTFQVEFTDTQISSPQKSLKIYSDVALEVQKESGPDRKDD